jgi:hypothetical protein
MKPHLKYLSAKIGRQCMASTVLRQIVTREIDIIGLSYV